MVSKEDQERIIGIISRYYEVRSFKADDEDIVVYTDDISKYPQEYFSVLVKDLGKYRYVAFTRSKDTIIVIKSVDNGRRNFLKALMGLFTVISLFYVGYSYVFSYFGTGVFLTILYTTVSFVIPVLIIIASREAGRYIAFRRNNMKYTLPVLIPDPIGLGTMGIINNSNSAYPNRKAMIEAASFSLIFGFFASLVFVAIGDYLSFMNPLPVQGPRSPLIEIGSPIIFQLIMKNVIPSNGILYPTAYAGWIGIVVNSFNALPLGYLDGGLISSAYLGKNSVYLSYASVIVVIGMSIIYPPWLVLPVFALIVGIRGPEPLNNISRTNINMKALAAISIAILFIGIVPVSYHPSPSAFSVQYGTDESIVWNVSAGSMANVSMTNATFNISIINQGGTTLTPAFAISPAVKFNVNSSEKSIGPGKNAAYTVTIPMNGMKYGIYSYVLDVYSATGSQQIPLKVYDINISSVIEIGQNGTFNLVFKGKFPVNSTENISIISDIERNDYVNVEVFSSTGSGYTATVEGADLMFHSSFPYFLGPGKSFDISVNSTRDQTVYIVAYDQNYSGDFAIMDFMK